MEIERDLSRKSASWREGSLALRPSFQPSAGRTAYRMKAILRCLSLFLFCVLLLSDTQSFAQDWVHTGSNLGNAPIRLAAADFKPVGTDPQTPALKAVFDATLFNDLNNA